jgi:hypothetical protein
MPQEGNTLAIQRRIAELERIERAHDDYLAALRRLAEHAAGVTRDLDAGKLEADRRYWIGWLSCLRYLEAIIVEQARRKD